jgi:hypothetical protein
MKTRSALILQLLFLANYLGFSQTDGRILLEDVSINGAIYHLVNHPKGSLLLRNQVADEFSPSLSVVKFNDSGDPVWLREVKSDVSFEPLFSFSFDETTAYFLFANRRFSGIPSRANIEMQMLLENAYRPDPSLDPDNSFPRIRNRLGFGTEAITVRWLDLESGSVQARSFGAGIPIRFASGDVSWPNFMVYGLNDERPVLFSGNLLTGETTLITLNTDLFTNILSVSAIPQSDGRFAIALSNKANEVFVIDVDGERPRLFPDGDRYVFIMNASDLHMSSHTGADRFFAVTGRYKGENGTFLIDLGQDLKTVRLPLNNVVKVTQNDFKKQRARIMDVYRNGDDYFLTVIKKQPYKTWFQNMDPFFDHYRLIADISRRSWVFERRTSVDFNGLFSSLLEDFTSRSRQGYRAGEARMADINLSPPTDFSNLDLVASPFDLPQSRGRLNPVFRLLERKRSYSPARQDGFSAFSMNTKGEFLKGKYFAQSKDKIVSPSGRLAVSVSDKGIHIIAAEKEGFALYDWDDLSIKRTFGTDPSDSDRVIGSGFNRVGFLGLTPVGIRADYAILREPFSKLHTVQYFLFKDKSEESGTL